MANSSTQCCGQTPRAEAAAADVRVSAELLALNAALGAGGDDRATTLLRELSRDLLRHRPMRSPARAQTTRRGG